MGAEVLGGRLLGEVEVVELGEVRFHDIIYERKINEVLVTFFTPGSSEFWT